MTEINSGRERNNGTSTKDSLVDRVKQGSKDIGYAALATPGVTSAATGFALGYAGREAGGSWQEGLPGAPAGLAVYNGDYPQSSKERLQWGAYAAGVAAAYADQIMEYMP